MSDTPIYDALMAERQPRRLADRHASLYAAMAGLMASNVEREWAEANAGGWAS